MSHGRDLTNMEDAVSNLSSLLQNQFKVRLEPIPRIARFLSEVANAIPMEDHLKGKKTQP